MHRITTEMTTIVAATVIMAVLVLFLGTAVAQPLAQPGDRMQGDARGCIEAPLSAVSESGLEGTAWLCVNSESVRPALQVRGLQEGEVYTAWLAYFDRPSACFHTPCAFVDLHGDDPVGVLGRVGGGVAPAARQPELNAELRDLKLSMGSQVSLLIVSQGAGHETDGRTRARQLLTPRMFDLGAPMAGAFADRARGQLHAQAILTIE